MKSDAEVLVLDKSTNVRINIPLPVRFAMGLLSRVAPGMAAKLAIGIFLHPQGSRPLRPAEEKLLATATPFRLQAEGYDLPAWSWGNGPTVLLQHGWGSRGSHLGQFVEPLVKAGYSVVTYDAPAHGQSPGRTTNAFEVGRVVLQLTRKLGGVHAIIGHSIGCSASGFAMRAGAPVQRAVFLNPPDEMETHTAQFAAALGFTNKVFERIKTDFESSAKGLWTDFEPSSLARGQRAPLLVISDRDDRTVPWRGGRAIAEAWPDGEFHQTAGLGHLRVLKNAAVIERVVEFVRG
ncbi:MAG: alpha/beta fold hydrolase [Candidatus Krumholzibacteria bacterium]|nr:alpha/beta fold hydrolase [Candidatus Krumholzibacteria bacterium]